MQNVFCDKEEKKSREAGKGLIGKIKFLKPLNPGISNYLEISKKLRHAENFNLISEVVFKLCTSHL